MHEDSRESAVALAFFALLALVLYLVSASGAVPAVACPVGAPCPYAQSLAAADLPLGATETPVMNLPAEMRTSNWGGGSCVHASTYHLLNWQGNYEMAEWWKKTYSGGEYSGRLNQRMEAAGLRYAYTVDGNVELLEWACRTRRGAGISYFPNHAINLVHLDAERAGLLDNNRKDQIIWVPREEFIRNWRGYGGWAWTLVYNPPPPLPQL